MTGADVTGADVTGADVTGADATVPGDATNVGHLRPGHTTSAAGANPDVVGQPADGGHLGDGTQVPTRPGGATQAGDPAPAPTDTSATDAGTDAVEATPTSPPGTGAVARRPMRFPKRVGTGGGRRWPGRPAWRPLVVALAALGGLASGAGVMVGVQGHGGAEVDGAGTGAGRADVAADRHDAAGRTTYDGPAAAVSGDGPVPTGEAGEAVAPAADAGDVLLAWSPGRLTPGLIAAAEAHPDVTGVSVGRAGVVDLVGSRTADGRTVDAPDAGWAVPLDAVALDPAAHVAFVGVADRAAVTGLGDGEALLGRTSAGLRRLGPGGTLVFAGGAELTVAAVVDDATIGGAELATSVPTGERIGVSTPRYLLAIHADARPAVEAALRRALASPAGAPPPASAARPNDAAAPVADGSAVRFRAPGETPFLRHGDAVLTSAQLKERFGEFAYRRAGEGRMFAAHDDAWRSEHVVRQEVPILGVVECHRGILDALAGALGDIEAAGLADLVRPEGYAGCWVPRLVGEGGAVSHHAWGVALDLNWDRNPSGAESRQDARVIEAFARWGFTWGGDWLEPDPAHLEYVGPPPAEPAAARPRP